MNKYIIGALVLAVVLIFAARYFDNDQETVSAVPSVSSALTVVEEP